MKKPTRKEAILQKCWDCQGHYFDGKSDCENPGCPLYTYMPYAKQTANLRLFEYSPKHKGFTTKESLKAAREGITPGFQKKPEKTEEVNPDWEDLLD
jgi:hypothetical protein